MKLRMMIMMRELIYAGGNYVDDNDEVEDDDYDAGADICGGNYNDDNYEVEDDHNDAGADICWW